MAAGWFSILNKLPWSEVIGNAPAVAQGAKKLWSTVSGKVAEAQPAPVPEPASEAAPAAEAFATQAAVDQLRSRLGAAEAATTELQRQMRSSSELINALAEQNAQLVVRIEMLSRRLAGLAAIGAVVGAVGLGGLAYLLWR